MKKVNISESTVDRAYVMADEILRAGVDSAEALSQDGFIEHMAFCQIMASRILGVIVFHQFLSAVEQGEGETLNLSYFVDKSVEVLRMELRMIEQDQADFDKEKADKAGSMN